METSRSARTAAIFLGGAVFGCLCGFWWAGSDGAESAPSESDSSFPVVEAAPAEEQTVIGPREIFGTSPITSPSGSDASLDASVMDMLTLLNEASKVPNQEQRRRRLEELLKSWAANDPLLAYRYATTQSRFSDRAICIQAVLTAWAEQDTTAVLQLAGDLVGRVGQNDAWRWIVEATGPIAPEETIRFLEQLPTGGLQSRLMAGVAEKWSRTSPLAAYAWARTLSPGLPQMEIMQSVFAGWAESDPRGAAAEAAVLPKGKLREVALAATARQFAATDPFSALHWFHGLDPVSQRDDLWRSIVALGVANYLDGQPPRAALQTVDQLMAITPDPERRKHLAALAANRITLQDPELVRTWVMQLPEGPDRNEAIKNLVAGWAQIAPGEAVAFAVENYNGTDAAKEFGSLAGWWARFDPTAAMSFAANLPDGEARQRIMEGVVDSMARLNPELAAQHLGQFTDPQKQADAAGKVLQEWVQTDPVAATAWLSQFPEGEARTKGYYSVARAWAFKDPNGTADWLNAQPAGPDRDEAIQAFVSSVDGYDIALANQWAAAIQDPAKRSEATNEAYRRWLHEDQPAAINWLTTGPMDAALRDHLSKLAAQQLSSRP